MALIVECGADAINALPEGIRSNPEAVAETIINNVRKTIVDERALNPKYYDQMSVLLDAIIEKRRREAEDYATYLDDLLALTAQVGKQESESSYPDWASTPARRALVDFDWPNKNDVDLEELSVSIVRIDNSYTTSKFPRHHAMALQKFV